MHEIHDALRAKYGISGDITRLHSEFDHNYCVSANSRRYIFKVMRCGCDFSFVEMQIDSMREALDAGVEVSIPRTVSTSDGAPTCTVSIAGELRLCWLISHLDGELLEQVHPWTVQMAEELGRGLATLDLSLKDFRHRALDRYLKWDLANADWLSSELSVHSDPARRMTIQRIAAAYCDDIKPLMLSAPRAVIHNDANETNILFGSAHGGGRALTGIIDFGDMVRSIRITEPAVAAVYYMIGAEEPLNAAAALLAAYHRVSPLAEREIALYFPLMLTRMAMSATLAAQQESRISSDPYFMSSGIPAWNWLNRYANSDWREMEERFRLACGFDAGHRS